MSFRFGLAISVAAAALAWMISIHGVAADPLLELPWPSGLTHRMNSGNPGYNCRPTHIHSNEYALDFEFQIDDLVSAAADGVVADASDKNLDDHGNFLEIDHGGGFRTRYLHLRLSQPFSTGITIGSKVAHGQLIAYSGNTVALLGEFTWDPLLE